MTPEGGLVPVEDEKAYKPAKPLLRYSPKKGSLSPGGSQILQFTLDELKGIEEGEYRSQLRIEGSLAGESNSDAAKIAYNLPIILRHGDLNATADLELVGLDKKGNGQPVLALNILRDGNRSLFGSFTITNAEGRVIGETKGMSVYEPLRKRLALVDLNGLLTSEITVRFDELEEYGGDNKVKRIFHLR